MTDRARLLQSASGWVAPGLAGAALVVGVVVGLGPALLVLAGGALLSAILLLWSSLGRLTGESPLTLEEAIGLAAPSPEEERKRSILRALKDLEYERSVGKISEEDFAELSRRYRTEAKALLQSIEAGLADRRRAAEAKLERRLRRESLSPAPETPFEEPVSSSAPRPDAAPDDGRICGACALKNDPDARFCKGCGAALGATEAAS